MLNKVREAVSQDRRRFKDDEFNLDLSYVTSRIIGTPVYLSIVVTTRNMPIGASRRQSVSEGPYFLFGSIFCHLYSPYSALTGILFLPQLWPSHRKAYKQPIAIT